MNVLKKNVKLIIGIIIGVILVSGISIGATVTYLYNANEVKYNDEKSVAEALDELYVNKRDTTNETKIITTNGEQTLDKYYKNINVNVNSNNDNNIILSNKVANANYNLNTGNTENRSGKWKFNNKGLDLYISHNYDNSNDSDAKYTYWCYIPLKVSKTGKYLFYMIKTNQQHETNTGTPLYFGISSTPVQSRSSYNIANSTGNNIASIINLSADTNYYIGANFDLTWNNWGYAKISFSDIMLMYVE